MIKRPLLAAAAASLTALSAASAEPRPRLYWFVPDGMRADIGGKSVFELAASGKYPNIRKMMENGSYGYSLPDYPSNTPVNFATLMTGCHPDRHGVSDGQMRLEGNPLARPTISGFPSSSKKVPAAWRLFEEAGRKVALVSIPGSTPPEGSTGLTVRGRWGSWGSDLWALNFEVTRATLPPEGNSSRLFFMGPQLSRRAMSEPAAGWDSPPQSFSPPLQTALAAYGTTVYAYIYDPDDDGKEDYSRVMLSLDKRIPAADLGSPGSWGAWSPVTLRWGQNELSSHMRIAPIRSLPTRDIKVRLLFDPLNGTTVQPADAAAGLSKGSGPMVDFPDNWPAQPNNYPEEKSVFSGEASMALEWHRAAVPYVYSSFSPDVFIHDTYTPNQMLESRWWLPAIDPDSSRYSSFTADERTMATAAVSDMYKRLDDILGEAIRSAGEGSLIVLSSDHGIAPLNRYFLLNNLLAREGLLKFSADPASGTPVIDWPATRAAHLKMIGVYLRPDNLAGPWKRGAGPEYEELRERVAGLMLAAKDGDVSPVLKVVRYEDAGSLGLPKDRVPDLLAVMRPGYGLTEDMSEGLPLFRDAVEGGYKQALLPENTPSLRTPFVVMGPGVKKHHRIPRDISNADQPPTLLRLTGVPVPAHMQGRVIDEILDN